MATELLQPAVALLLWTAVMWVWMYATRIPAIGASGIEFDSAAPNGDQLKELPAAVRWKADNYNHLHEQPTLFYAVIAFLVLANAVSSMAVILAWTYVGIRVVHSLVQSLGNPIPLRFGIFCLASLALFGLFGLAALAVF
ncbi:MAG: MAPEG family protein [Pseudomonadota bacterium]